MAAIERGQVLVSAIVPGAMAKVVEVGGDTVKVERPPKDRVQAMPYSDIPDGCG